MQLHPSGPAANVSTIIVALCSALWLGCQGESVNALSNDASTDSLAVPDTPLSDAWPPSAITASPGCGSFPGPKMVRLEASKPFCIDTTEVTNAQYDVFLGSVKPEAPAYCFKPNYGTSQTALRGANKPRTNVTWCEAYQYCAWAGKRLCGKIDGGHNSVDAYLGVNDSQWSFACRQGAKNTDYPYGAARDQTKCTVTGPLIDVGTKKTCSGESAPFDQIFDLSGNAGEWSDACDRYEGVTGDDERVCALRGGWIDNSRQDCNEPQRSSVMYQADDLSFRCCKDL